MIWHICVILGGSDELIDEAVAGLGVAKAGFGQIGEEQGDGAIMDGRGHAMEVDGQGACGVVGDEIGPETNSSRMRARASASLARCGRSSPTSAVSAR